jgi:hypothetical protein
MSTPHLWQDAAPPAGAGSCCPPPVVAVRVQFPESGMGVRGGSTEEAVGACEQTDPG